MAVTIKDVAEAANVSISAVSYAMNNSGPVSEEKKERIFKAVKELGYVQNGMARSLRLQKKDLLDISQIPCMAYSMVKCSKELRKYLKIMTKNWWQAGVIQRGMIFR